MELLRDWFKRSFSDPQVVILGLVLVAALSLSLLGGCSKSKVVTRTDPDEQIDLSGNWNDTDSRYLIARFGPTRRT